MTLPECLPNALRSLPEVCVQPPSSTASSRVGRRQPGVCHSVASLPFPRLFYRSLSVGTRVKTTRNDDGDGDGALLLASATAYAHCHSTHDGGRSRAAGVFLARLEVVSTLPVARRAENIVSISSTSYYASAASYTTISPSKARLPFESSERRQRGCR